tara:strand:+ start:53 stop:781 length:729 start_codon:yes stop_codon:yes gene_type:complete
MKNVSLIILLSISFLGSSQWSYESESEFSSKNCIYIKRGDIKLYLEYNQYRGKMVHTMRLSNAISEKDLDINNNYRFAIEVSITNSDGSYTRHRESYLPHGADGSFSIEEKDMLLLIESFKGGNKVSFKIPTMSKDVYLRFTLSGFTKAYDKLVSENYLEDTVILNHEDTDGWVTISGDLLTVETVEGTESFEIFNLRGEAVITYNNPGTEVNIDLSELSKGIYIVLATKGSETITERFDFN